MDNPLEHELSRRRLLIASGGVLTLAGTIGLLERLSVSDAIAQGGPGANDPLVRRTIEAFADTIVPGPAGGADPDPGAIESGTVDEMYDPFYGASGVFPSIYTDLAVATPQVLGRPATFDLGLSYADRELVVLDRVMGGDNTLYLAYVATATLIWQIYYGVAASNDAVEYMNFRPHSDGYWPQHSYRLRFRGMTRNGNPD